MNYFSLLVHLAVLVSLAAGQEEETVDEMPMDPGNAKHTFPSLPRIPMIPHIPKRLPNLPKPINVGKGETVDEMLMDPGNARPTFPSLPKIPMIPHGSNKYIIPKRLPNLPKPINVGKGEETDMPSKPMMIPFSFNPARKIITLMPTTGAADNWRSKKPGVPQVFGKFQKGGLKKETTHMTSSATETSDTTTE